MQSRPMAVLRLICVYLAALSCAPPNEMLITIAADTVRTIPAGFSNPHLGGLFAVDERGNVAVVDGEACVVDVVVALGPPSRLMRRCGDGPSEVSAVSAVTIRDSQVVVLSGNARRFVWWSSVGNARTLESPYAVDRMWLTSRGLLARRNNRSELLALSVDGTRVLSAPAGRTEGCTMCPLGVSEREETVSVVADSAAELSVVRIGTPGARMVRVATLPPEDPGPEDSAMHAATLRYAERLVLARTGVPVRLGGAGAPRYRLRRLSAVPPWVDQEGSVWAVLRRALPNGDLLVYTPPLGTSATASLQLAPRQRILAGSGKFALVLASAESDTLHLLRLRVLHGAVNSSTAK